jgi:hypothetical protein
MLLHILTGQYYSNNAGTVPGADDKELFDTRYVSTRAPEIRPYQKQRCDAQSSAAVMGRDLRHCVRNVFTASVPHEEFPL